MMRQADRTRSRRPDADRAAQEPEQSRVGSNPGETSHGPRCVEPTGGVGSHTTQAAEPSAAEVGPETEARIAEINDRYLNRPPAIPDDNARQNLASIQRNTEAHHDAAPSGEPSVPESVRSVIASPGRSLEPSVREPLENRMDASFDDVRIHTGAKAVNACEEINARAFTVGNHIAFNQGEYDPSSAQGQRLIAHELAHVRQQTGGALSLLAQADGPLDIDPDSDLEREAAETADRVLRGEDLGIQRATQTGVHLQRAVSDHEQDRWTRRTTLFNILEDRKQIKQRQFAMVRDQKQRLEQVVETEPLEIYLHRLQILTEQVNTVREELREIRTAHQAWDAQHHAPNDHLIHWHTQQLFADMEETEDYEAQWEDLFEPES